MAADPAPLVSVVLPVHNGARYLRDAIQSVLIQSLTNLELIAVDDGSADASPAILAGAAACDPRVRIITNASNRGLPASLNIGFAAARGALHSWTSDDNRLDPDMLERLAAALEASGADLAYAGYRVVDGEDRILRHVPARPIGERFFGNVVGAAFLYRAELWRALGGYDEGRFGSEDYDFWLRAARRFTCVPVAEELYTYRRHGDSLTDTRARAIAAQVESLLARELAAESDRRLVAQAWLTEFTRRADLVRPRLLARALAADPSRVLAATPLLTRFVLRAGRRRLGGEIAARPPARW